VVFEDRFYPAARVDRQRETWHSRQSIGIFRWRWGSPLSVLGLMTLLISWSGEVYGTLFESTAGFKSDAKCHHKELVLVH
jgi:hypothetical protein